LQTSFDLEIEFPVEAFRRKSLGPTLQGPWIETRFGLFEALDGFGQGRRLGTVEEDTGRSLARPADRVGFERAHRVAHPPRAKGDDGEAGGLRFDRYQASRCG
jgi:hypothetical protein